MATLATVVAMVFVSLVLSGVALPYRAGLQTVLVMGGVGLLVRHVTGVRASVGAVTLRIVLASLAVGAAMAIAGNGLMGVIVSFFPEGSPWIEQRELVYRSLLRPDEPSLIPWIILCVAVAPALFEEFFFRGVVRELVPVRGRVVVVGALFALAHIDPLGLLPLFAFGCVLTWMAERTWGWGSAVPAHFALNLLNAVVWVRLVPSTPPVLPSLGLLVAGSIALGGSMYLLHRAVGRGPNGASTSPRVRQ